MVSFEPQDGASTLAPHPNRLTLQGSAASLQFPPLCPNCGSAAAERLTYAKVFRHTDDDGPTRYDVSSVTVPFCAACVAQHRAQEVRRSFVSDLFAGLASVEILGAVFPALGALFMLRLALGDLAHARGVRMLVEMGIGAVFGLIAWMQAHAVWQQSAHLRVPPQSDITLAFDFSNDISSTFESARFACTIRNGAFANALRLLNIDREYLPRSEKAIAERARARRWLWVFGAMVAAVGAWSVVRELFG